MRADQEGAFADMLKGIDVGRLRTALARATKVLDGFVTSPRVLALIAAEERRRAALRRFRRTMRRHEKRARSMGFLDYAEHLSSVRRWVPLGIRHQGVDEDDLRADASALRHVQTWDGRRSLAFLYERAADAVAKYRAATEAT